MRSRNILSWGLLCSCLSYVFVGTAKANTLFSIDSHKPAAVRVYSIDGYVLTNPVTISAETIGLGPVGIAASEDLGLVFVTYESEYDVVVINSKTLEKVAQIQTLVYNPAGIVADDVKDKIYIMQRNTNNMYVYTWNENTKDLDLEGDGPQELADLPNKGMGIALDGEYLYVTDTTRTVRCYNTTTWAHETDYDITLTDGLWAYGIAVYNDGAGNRFGYFGGWMWDNRFIKVDLDNPANQTIITPSENKGVAGITTDPDTGYVYASVADYTNRVFDTSFNEVYSIETGINPPDAGPAEFSASCIASASPTAQLQQYTTDKADNPLIKVGT